LGSLALLSIVNKFGTNVIAGFSVASRIDFIAMIPAMSFSQALSTFVGQNIGAGKTERIRSGLISTVRMSGGVTIISTVVILLCGQLIMSLFTKDSEVIRIGTQYLTIVSIFYAFITLMFIYNGVMRGAGDTLLPMFFSLISLWIIRVPLAYILSGRIGVAGIWWSIPAGWFIGLALSFLYYKSGNWKTKAVVKYAEIP
jgi:Na+-driven multidrug efflux pump